MNNQTALYGADAVKGADTVRIMIRPKEVIRTDTVRFGIFFEDLNHAADGGLYAELVRNRSFAFDAVDHEGYHHLTAWEYEERGGSLGSVHIESRHPLSENTPYYAVLEAITAGEGVCLRNTGFGDGICAGAGETLLFSCRVRSEETGTDAALHVRLENEQGQPLSNELCLRRDVQAEPAGRWAELTGSLTVKSDRSAECARLCLFLTESGTMDLTLISLFPECTFCGRRNGLRKDLAQLLCDLHPAFIRFPGGCLTHIGMLDRSMRTGMYAWKTTIGPLEDRPARRNSWNYNQTLGLGFYEFLLFCEDIGAEPLPVIDAGYDPHALRTVPMDEMDRVLQDALDLIEFANGPAESSWGRVRAEMGHEKPFGLTYLAIGNEEVGDAYFERYRYLSKKLQECNPALKLISSGGPGSAGSEFTAGWKTAGETGAAFVDEHFYQCREWFVQHADRYDSYDPKGPKVFLGEYASHDTRMINALSEAVFMLGMEKAPAAGLACYAPLLCHTKYTDWKADLIYFDEKSCCPTPNYYVQQAFMQYGGEEVIAASDDLPEEETPLTLDGAVTMASAGSWEIDHWHVRVSAEPARAGSIEERTEAVQVSAGVTGYGPVHVGGDDGAVSFGTIRAQAYDICFSFMKTEGNLRDSLEGSKRLEIHFAESGRKCGLEKMEILIDAWERMLYLNGVYPGGTCDMGLWLLPVEIGRRYDMRITVRGREVSVFVDGKRCLQTSVRTRRVKKLYYSAVRERTENGRERYIVKAVNLGAQPQQTEIALNGKQIGDIRVQVLAGEGPDDTNTMSEPARIRLLDTVSGVTVSDTQEGSGRNGNRAAVEISPWSLTVITMETED